MYEVIVYFPECEFWKKVWWEADFKQAAKAAVSWLRQGREVKVRKKAEV